MKNFDDQQELAQWLANNDIDYEDWGQGESKTLANLWAEFVNGECSFREDPPIRMVEVVQISISRGAKTLLEVAQVLGDGRRRSRNRLPSDKIKQGENVFDAALRCLQEELVLRQEQIEIKSKSYEKEEKVLDSPSYPGLTSHYVLHLLEAKVTGLPDGPFWRENKGFGKGDPVQRHLWDWVAVE